MDRKHHVNDTLRSRVQKHRVISKFKENSIQNHFDSSDDGKVHKFVLYSLQNIIIRNNLFISESVEQNIEQRNIEVDDLDHLLNFETHEKNLFRKTSGTHV